MDQQSFGLTAGVDLNPPDYRFDDCSLTFSFINDPLVGSKIHDADCTKGPLNPTFPISVEYKSGCPVVDPTQEVSAQVIPVCEAVHLMMPNYIDNLNTKKVRIQVLYDPQFPSPSVKFPGGVKEDVNPGVPEVNPEICFRDALPTNTIPGYFFEDWTCNKNPVNEVIWFDITGSVILEIAVDTVSFGMPVGGEMIPLDSTMVLVAGTQTTAAWMFPIIVAAAGFGLIIQTQITRLKNNMCPNCKSETEDKFELGEKLVGKCKNSKCRVSLFFLK